MNNKSLLRKSALTVGTLALAAGAAGTIAASSASAATTAVHPVRPLPAAGSIIRYEADNGITWTLSNSPLKSKITPGTGYADAGIVVNLGEYGYQYQGVSAGNYGPQAVNLWIANGSQATRPGTHALTSPVNFAYGSVDPATGDVTMFDGAYAGQTLTPAQIQADYPANQLYAWAGIDESVTQLGSASLMGQTNNVKVYSLGVRHHRVVIVKTDILKVNAAFPETLRIRPRATVAQVQS